MPYIKKEDRQKFKDLPDNIENAGELNYVITQILAQYLKSKGLRYQNINEIIGVLDCAKQEFYRLIAIPYENKKREENGDVAYKDL